MILVLLGLFAAISLGIWIAYEIDNAAEAIEDEDGNIIGYKQKK
jgi:hypothetical protein